LTNIKKNKDAALKQLDIQYATADKAKTSFGYIGVTFLACLFGSVFANDFLKLFLHYFNRLRDWWRQRRNINQNNADQREQVEEEEENQVQLEIDRDYADDLEQKLEAFYFKLVETNANNRLN
jgi:hypothetical protein